MGHEDRLLRHSLLTSLVLVISYPVANELPVNVPILQVRRPGGVVPTLLRSCLLGFCLLSKYGRQSNYDSHSDKTQTVKACPTLRQTLLALKIAFGNV